MVICNDTIQQFCKDFTPPFPVVSQRGQLIDVENRKANLVSDSCPLFILVIVSSTLLWSIGCRSYSSFGVKRFSTFSLMSLLNVLLKNKS